jgi:hypothetical protein
MGVFNYEAETPSVIPAARLFKAFILDGDNLIPKAVLRTLKEMEGLEPSRRSPFPKVN